MSGHWWATPTREDGSGFVNACTCGERFRGDSKRQARARRSAHINRRAGVPERHWVPDDPEPAS